MFISKQTLNSILARLDALEEARFHEKDRLRNMEQRQAEEEDRAAQKYEILLARIKASENGRFVYDDRTGKVLPVITGLADARRELAAAVMEKADAPKQAPKPKPAPAQKNADDEPALFTQAEQEKLRRFYDLNFEILTALKICRAPNGITVMLNRRKNGNSTACRYAEKYAPTYARFVNSMSGCGSRLSYILTAAADRGVISCERGSARKSPRIYIMEEIIEVFRQAEKFISEHREKFEEFIREGAEQHVDH